MLADKKAVIGRSYWTILHQMPSGMHDPPTQAEAVAFIGFLDASSEIYPCTTCRPGFFWVKAHPPDLSTRNALSSWICDFHNAVNAHLGKPIHSCTVVKAEECPTCTIKAPERKHIGFVQLL